MFTLKNRKLTAGALYKLPAVQTSKEYADELKMKPRARLRGRPWAPR